MLAFLVAYPLLLIPALAYAAIGAAVIFALAWKSVAIPIAAVGVPGVLIALLGSNPFPEGAMPIFMFGWASLAIFLVVMRDDTALPLRVLSSVPLVCTIGLAALMLARLGSSAVPEYGSFKLKLFIVQNITVLVAGIVIGRKKKDFDLFVVLTLLVSAAGALVLVRMLLAGAGPVLGERFALSEESNPIQLGRASSKGLLVASFLLLAGAAAWKRLLALAVIPVIGVALIASGSRGPLLGLILGLTVLAVLLLRGGTGFRRVLFIPVGGIGAAFLVPALVPGNAVERSLSILFGGEDSNGRARLWESAWQGFSDNVAFGMGTGGFARIAPDNLYPHNIVLEAGVELGILGLLLMVGFIVFAFRQLRRDWTELPFDSRPAVALVAALFGSALINAFVSSDISGNSGVWLATGLAIGLGLRAGIVEPVPVAETISRMRARRDSKGPRVPARIRHARPAPAAPSAPPPGVVRSRGGITSPAEGAIVCGEVEVAAAPGETGWGVAAMELQYAAVGSDWHPIAALRDETFDVFGAADAEGRQHLAIVRSRRLAELIQRSLETREEGFEEIEIAPSRQRPWRSRGAQAAVWETTALPDGPHALRVVSTDLAGRRVTSEETLVSVDNLPPEVALTRVEPTAGRLELAATATDVGSSVAWVSFEISDGGKWIEAARTETAPYEARVGIAPGGYEVRVRAADRSGHEAIGDPVPVATEGDVRAEPLAGALLEPEPGSVIAGEISLVADVSASASNLLFQFSADGGSWRPAIGRSAGRTVLGWDTSRLPDGDYKLRVVAFDDEKNLHASAPVDVTIDNTAPTAALTAPLHGDALQGTVTLAAVAEDVTSGVAHVGFHYAVDATGWTEIGWVEGGGGELVWDTARAGDGGYWLCAVATDRAGWTTMSETVYVTVENAPPGPEPAEPQPVFVPDPEPAAYETSAAPDSWTLPELERILAEGTGDAYVQDEREALLTVLRGYANEDGTIPSQFETLVIDAFGDPPVR